ncbi:MAG: formylglycine-generating enzyme family protein [Alphaproteobacteria bacterium]|nr:formylglycine-generating enzyme family protein [Alphaproteobacteria bacterium]
MPSLHTPVRRRWFLLAGALLCGAGLALPALQGRGLAVSVEAERSELRSELIDLPGGTFLMGSPPERAGGGETPQHEVTLSPFTMCRAETTQAQYVALMGENPSLCDHGCGDALPVHRVSWNQATEFLNRLTEAENQRLRAAGRPELSRCYEGEEDAVRWIEGCTGYRLPTEAEWEYAARGGTTTQYSWGEDAGPAERYAWFGEGPEGQVHPVGQKEPNPWGFYDIHGNVMEWVWDRQTPYTAGPETNPRGSEGSTNHALRGGSVKGAAQYLRPADRDYYSRDCVEGMCGIRCARGAQSP